MSSEVEKPVCDQVELQLNERKVGNWLHSLLINSEVISQDINGLAWTITIIARALG